MTKSQGLPRGFVVIIMARSLKKLSLATKILLAMVIGAGLGYVLKGSYDVWGLGPVEDGEGNTNYGAKGELMASLALDAVPSVIVESKAYSPTLSAALERNRFMIRAQKGVDCTRLGRALLASAGRLQLPARFEESLMPFTPGGLARGTAALANEVIQLAQKLKEADSSAEKVQIVAQLNRLLSEEAGGVTFMSNSVNDVMRGAGTLPKISAVLSLVTAPEEANCWKIPLLTDEECRAYRRIIFGALAA